MTRRTTVRNDWKSNRADWGGNMGGEGGIQGVEGKEFDKVKIGRLLDSSPDKKRMIILVLVSRSCHS